MNTQIQLTNEDILEKIGQSSLIYSQKESLIHLVPHMTDEEKNNLLDFIGQSENIDKNRTEHKKNYIQGLNKLNADYSNKINELEKDQIANTRKTYEKAEGEKDEKTLEDLEGEIDNL